MTNILGWFFYKWTRCIPKSLKNAFKFVKLNYIRDQNYLFVAYFQFYFCILLKLNNKNQNFKKNVNLILIKNLNKYVVLWKIRIFRNVYIFKENPKTQTTEPKRNYSKYSWRHIVWGPLIGVKNNQKLLSKKFQIYSNHSCFLCLHKLTDTPLKI